MYLCKHGLFLFPANQAEWMGHENMRICLQECKPNLIYFSFFLNQIHTGATYNAHRNEQTSRNQKKGGLW